MTSSERPSAKLRLGTRRSPLAMAQAEETRRRLCEAHGWEESDVELVPVLASGDKVLDRPLAEIGGKALWTKELDAWLHEGLIDAAVHSMKDVETLRPDWLTIAAILPREDVRDVLVGAGSIADLPPGSRIGTSAPRRAAQLLHLRPDCSVVSFRGNVATRLGRLEAGEADATLLAAAGLNRLGESHVGTPLALDQWLPAPAQGAIGIECNADDDATRALIAAIDDAPSRAQVMAERALLAGLGGTCHSPIAVLSRMADGQLAMRAAIFSPDGAERVEHEVRFAPGDDDAPRALAAELLARAGPAIRQHFTGSAE
ncbi:hydroxymethylbilane synthase [Altererythrobacter sp. CC-YST694]|uniref:hydroxymethylbilane synthase n=1 Tax=Altererythrobacter sp. CC-YST694 TaxID=2755038 RepID=UPI001D01051B|nr:hydroxymethylbilane synthase [Altererythrobacter sp. CC-YST694]MCB5423890.1 hydroxymethylbilane synthase [Altererythrobacter sp. CC-YST694]